MKSSITIFVLSDVRAYEAVLAFSAYPNPKLVILIDAIDYQAFDTNKNFQIKHLNQELVKNLCNLMNIPIKLTKDVPLELDLISDETLEIMADFKILSHLTKSVNSSLHERTRVSKVGAITSMADIYLAGASLFRSVKNPKKFDASLRWKVGLKQSPFQYWIMPKLMSGPLSLAGRPIEYIDKAKILNIVQQLYSQNQLPNWLYRFQGVIHNQPFFLVSPSMRLNDNEILNAKRKAMQLSGSRIPYLVKPHPREFFSNHGISDFERIFEYESLNSKCNIPTLELSSLPIEILLLLFPNSIYIGVLSGSIHVAARNRVEIISTNIKKYDKNLLFQYSEFMKYYLAK